MVRSWARSSLSASVCLAVDPNGYVKERFVSTGEFLVLRLEETGIDGRETWESSLETEHALGLVKDGEGFLGGI